ncbi:hypothetical protein [Oceanicoccus sagamiensis]|uniref:Co-chaperone DjlA N-terminal domain-containing protein n=1 Tax=Oceanicoccus sagamiensis TaxID=716816 RepID=A0A1X9N893_9GAMM|nr:hypothetical protein [Oceanicoccus sagamiensis]ARN72652.1 hypothetical protein BST96_00095 [Oceanicoccus sagamiensis]
MHIIIGLITAVAGLIWALHSLQNAGVDLNAFNPFTWVRRRKWEKQLGVKPMHGLTETMEAAALLVVGVVNVEGDITRDTKMDILKLFENEFGIKRNRSLELFSSSTHFLKDVINLDAEVKHVLAPSKSGFQESHVTKLVGMMQHVAGLEGEPSEQQKAIVQAVQSEFNIHVEKSTNW